MQSSEESIKDDVLKQLGDQIKALQLKQFNEAGNDQDSAIKCNNVHVKCLFDVLDHILLYGLKSPENGYWPFVCEFTHPEVKKDIDENPDVTSVFDKGRLWIYLALLDCLLGSYFRMFYENQKTPTKYYQRNSFVRDKERLGIIITLVAGLDLIRLSSELDLSFLGFRDFGLTNVLGNGPGSRNGNQDKTMIPMDSFPDREQHDIKSTDSNDVIDESTISLVEAEHDDEPLPKVDHNPFPIHQGSYPSEYEGIVLAGFPRRPGLSETLATTSDVAFQQHAIEKLALSIFDAKDETFHRFVKGFTGFHYGQLHAVHLLLTDKSVYFLRKQSGDSFTTEHSINFQELKHVEIGVNCQYVAFVSRNEKYSFSTANEAITRSLVTDISSLMVRGLSSPAQLTRIVSSTAVQGQQAIKKWLRSALEKQTIDVEVMCFSLVHWMCFSGPGSELDMVRHQIIKEGYLECKSKYLGVVSHWETNYFALTGRGLFHYSRQGDKEPKMIYELNASNCGGCRRVSDEEEKYAFEIISEDGQTVVILSSSTEDQASDWIMKLCQIVAGSSEFLYTTLCPAARAIPCCAAVTKEHVITFHAYINGEYRFLSSFCIQDVTQILVDNEVRNYCILKFESDHEGMWFFSFATEYELSKFERDIAEAWKDSLQADLQFYMIGEGPTRKRARDMSQHIQTILNETN
ncbi:pleckstrin homology domain-containing family M member 2-like [Dendronephthya gigantea]|uniref:pleckstrin homology domain-containing family M member 2-like n=1 Tax=Dendronephthya gigantea TaxID=151771 RepID=UPI00106C5AEF|nr:pleckstrin homology domain-containing family M member 2-like [Dendronephthya gigantea]